MSFSDPRAQNQGPQGGLGAARSCIKGKLPSSSQAQPTQILRRRRKKIKNEEEEEGKQDRSLSSTPVHQGREAPEKVNGGTTGSTILSGFQAQIFAPPEMRVE